METARDELSGVIGVVMTDLKPELRNLAKNYLRRN
jgi:hypothetical protein